MDSKLKPKTLRSSSSGPKIAQIGKEDTIKGTKRKSRANSISPRKKVKMNEEDVAKVVAEALKQSSGSFTAALVENKKDILTAIDSKLEPIAKDVSELNTKHDHMQSRIEEQGKDVDSLKVTVSKLKETLREELVQELGSNRNASDLAAYKCTLAAQNDQLSRNLIIHGLKSDNPREDVDKLINNLKLPADCLVQIVSVTKLGKGDGVKPASMLVVLANQYMRNEILRFTRNLPKGVYLDKDIPYNYREAYKRYRKKAWRYRTFLKVQTQIIFSGHLLQLRYRDVEESGKKAYTILEEYFPTPDLTIKSKDNYVKPGTLPSTSVSETAVEEAKEKLLLTGVGRLTQIEIDAKLRELLKKHEFEAIKNIEVINGNALITMTSKTLSSQVARVYSGKTSKDFKFSFETFE